MHAAHLPRQRDLLDASGVELLGMSLLSNGSVVLGLDAPAGIGNDANRERITLVVESWLVKPLRVGDPKPTT